MNATDYIGIIGGVLGIIVTLGSISAWVLFLGGWKKGVDDCVKTCGACAKIVPLALSDLKTKMDLIWLLQTSETLERQRLAIIKPGDPGSLTKRESPLAFTERGQQIVDAMRPFIDELRRTPGITRPTDVLTIFDRISMVEVTNLAVSMSTTPQALLSLMTVEIGFSV